MATGKRLIDANKLPYSIAVDDNGKQIFYVKAEDIDKAPTVDAVEVVRCRDCDYRAFDDVCKEYYCNCVYGMYGAIADNDFCSYGERRADV